MSLHNIAPPLPASIGPYIPWKPKTVDAFPKDKLIGEGTYGSVFLARMGKGQDAPQVALKRIRKEKKEGVCIHMRAHLKPSCLFMTRSVVLWLWATLVSNHSGA
jgi:hypothetical protein